jgi:Serine proteases of the peptidase family S9A
MSKPLFYFLKNISKEMIGVKALQYYLSFFFIGLLSQSVISDEPDPYLWLEEIEGKRSLAWVEEQNQETFSRYTRSKAFNEQYQKIKDRAQ